MEDDEDDVIKYFRDEIKPIVDEISIDDDWAEKDFNTSLNHLLKIAQQGGNPVYILEGLLSITSMYLSMSDLNDSNKSGDIERNFSVLKRYCLEKVLKSKTESFSNSMSIGQLVDVLINFGLPRIHALKAVSNLLRIGQSTVRTHHENYRIIYKEQPHKGHRLIEYVRLNYKRLEKVNSIEYDHVRANKAFRETKKYYSERVNVSKIMDAALDDIEKKFKKTK